jgi:Xaa-Pro aminopeptidase
MLVHKERLLRIMRNYGVEALIASMPENVTYLTDFWSISHWLLKGTQTYAVFPANEKISPYIVTTISDLDLAAIQEDCWIKDFVTFGKFFIESPSQNPLSPSEQRLKELFSTSKRKEDASSALVESLAERDLARGKIAIDEMNIPAPLYRAIQDKLPRTEIIHAYALLREIRAVKTPEEIKRLEKAVEITENAFHQAIQSIREGIREVEVAQVFNTAIAHQGGIPVLACIGAGYRSAFPNVQPSDYRVKKGDLIRFDIGCMHKNYYSDTARIAVWEKPSVKQRTYYQAIKEGEDRALAMIRPGVPAAEIFNEAVKGVRQAGIPHYQRSHVGHGIGIECYDPPFLNPSSGHILEEGMVVNVETPYYELGFGGVQVEDTLVITKNGYRMLTKADRNLFILQ